MADKDDQSAAAITLPKGGGAIQGIGETFQHDAFTGTAAWTVPIPVTAGRGGFGPELALRYGSGGGNGIFGLGWELSLPRIARKTDLGLPRYDDRDAFVMSGAEELVPQLARNGQGVETLRRGAFLVERFRPRIEGLFARVERWTDQTTGDVHWRATTRANVTSVYGRTTSARIADPADAGRVFSWLLEETFDARGNHLLYEYAGDDPALRLAEIFEDRRIYAQRYLRRIFYANLPWGTTDDHGVPVGVSRAGVDHANPLRTLERRYAIEVVFDYGSPSAGPAPGAAAPEIFRADDPPVRPDRFSTFRPGFELRTLRRCERVLVYHRFPELGGTTLVRSTRFGYLADPESGLSLLESVTVVGHRSEGGRAIAAEMPPVTFRYGAFRPREQRFRSLSARGGGLPATPLSNSDVALVDLFGQGAPDLLESTPAGFRYWKNLGDGEFDEPRVLPGAPAGLRLGDPGVAMADVDGDGQPEMLIHGTGLSGFFRTGPEGPLARFERFPAAPPFDPADPNLRFVDLTGDGRADAVILGDELLYWFENLGDQGFGPAQALPRLHDLDEFPDVFFADPSGRVHLADMNGDGLAEIVLLHQGRVDYWPNLGYGRFGRRVTMATLPEPPGLSPLFDSKRMMLADVTGTGCADVVYLDFDRIHIWFNRSGNAWSAPATIDGTPQATTADTVRPADIFGTGTASLVWSYDAGVFPGSHYKAIDLCGGVKPYLLEEMDNGLGAVTRVGYCSSTRFAFEDLRAGTPWVTRLPFPVHVVARSETIDHVGRTRLVSSYTYHHGHFDAAEREFRGFARVERLDTEDFASFARPLEPSGAPPENASAGLHGPPVLTVTWHHTGAAFEDAATLASRLAVEFYGGDAQAPTLPQDDVDLSDSPLEAFRTLKGAVLRTEIYARDGSPREPHPYAVECHSFEIRALQPRADRAAAVFLLVPRESLAIRYERAPGDPRLSHSLNLVVDDFGNVTRGVALSYPRRGAPAEPEQARTAGILTATRYINTPETLPANASQHRVGVPCETRSYEIAHAEALLPAGGLVRPAAFLPFLADLDDFVPAEATPPVPAKRLLAWTRSYFRADAAAAALPPPDRFDSRLPLGTIEPLGLPFETRHAMLTPGLRAQLYAGTVGDAELRAAGYLDSATIDRTLPPTATGLLWAAAGRQATDPALFHLPVRTENPFGDPLTLGYDRYALALSSTEDALGNVMQAQIDYRLLRPERTIDPNGNVTAVASDALGLVIATAVSGKAGEGDRLAGFALEPAPLHVDAFFADPVGQGRAMLGDATTRLVYDLRAPARVATIAREVHASEVGGDVSPLQISIGYSDGLGRLVQTRALTDARDVDGVLAPTRWIVSGWTIFDNKGRPVQKFEPFFSATPAFEFAATRGVAATIFYDPPGRPIATLRPDGAYEKGVFGAWDEAIWDANDTVTLVPRNDPDVAGTVAAFLAARPGFKTWLERRLTDPANPPPPASRTADQDAAVKALAHAGTPTRRLVDPLGRPFLVLDDVGGGRRLATRTAHDVEGRVLRITDPRGVTAFAYLFDMAGRTLRIVSADAGVRTLLPAADDKPVLALDGNGKAARTSYDGLRRQREVRVARGRGREAVVLRHVYGETLGAAAAATNHRTRILEVLDGAGTIVTTRYDFKGFPVETVRRFVADPTRAPDWSSDPEPTATRAFTTRRRFDALGRPAEEAAPDGSVTRRLFKPSGQLAAIEVVRAGGATLRLVEAIEHDAHGRRTRASHPGGVVTAREYDPESFRLTRLRAVRGTTTLQDLAYAYDPIGNITACADAAFETVFNANQRVDPVAAYVYDPLYRLIEATGREHEGLGPCAHAQDWSSSSPCVGGTKHAPFIALTPQPVNNGRALRNYREIYTYDDAGNLTEIQHIAGSRGSWTRRQTFDVASNRLATSDAGCPREARFAVPHDGNGNVTALAHLPALDWDHANRLLGAALGPGSTPDRALYAYDAGGARVRKTVVRGGTPSCARFYVGAYELFLDHATGADPAARETLGVSDGEGRLALLETWNERGTLQQRVRVQLANHLGSALLELDENGRAISYEEFSPYGETSYLAGTSFAEVQRKRYRYSGKERDDETGLYYFGARYYAGWLGRWLACDPVGDRGGLNAYARDRANPIAFVDPAGTADQTPVITQNPLDFNNLNESGVQVSGYQKSVKVETGSVKINGVTQETWSLEVRFTPISGEGEASYYRMQITRDSNIFVGTGTSDSVTTAKALQGNRLLERVWAEGFEIHDLMGEDAPEAFRLNVANPNTMNAMSAAGADGQAEAFLRATIGTRLRDGLSRIGLEIDPASVQIDGLIARGATRALPPAEGSEALAVVEGSVAGGARAAAPGLLSRGLQIITGPVLLIAPVLWRALTDDPARGGQFHGEPVFKIYQALDQREKERDYLKEAGFDSWQQMDVDRAMKLGCTDCVYFNPHTDMMGPGGQEIDYARVQSFLRQYDLDHPQPEAMGISAR